MGYRLFLTRSGILALTVLLTAVRLKSCRILPESLAFRQAFRHAT